MPAIVKLPSGSWGAQVRRKGMYVSNSFRRRADAEAWAFEAERAIDKGLDPKTVKARNVQSFAEIIDLHIQDMLEAGEAIRRSKAAALEALKILPNDLTMSEI